MNTSLLIGILGSIILVSGAAYPLKKTTHPVKSLKNWLFAIGGLLMLIYAILNYQSDGPIFFIFLQALVNLASIFMLSNTPEKISKPTIIISGLFLIICSLSLFENYNTIFFIFGLTGISLGYVINHNDFQRNLSLFLGSSLIAVFSYMEASWVFFWLNLFFAGFSGYYANKLKNNLNHKR